MTVRGLVLSLFPGIGLLDMAFEEEGFCVVRGPDLLWGGDIRRFHPPARTFDGVIGGPPCQAFSPLRRLVEHNGLTVAEDLIPEFCRVVKETEPRWFLMENVPEAPIPAVPGYAVRDVLVRDVEVGGRTARRRRFTFGTLDGRPLAVDRLALWSSDPEPTVLASGGAPRDRSATGYKTTAYLRKAIADQGLPDAFLADAPFTVAAKIKCVGNGVPLAMGRAIARAVRAALDGELPR